MSETTPKPTMTFTLTVEEWTMVEAVIRKLPFDVAQPILAQLTEQAQRQAPSAKPVSSPEPAPKGRARK